MAFKLSVLRDSFHVGDPPDSSENVNSITWNLHFH